MNKVFIYLLNLTATLLIGGLYMVSAQDSKELAILEGDTLWGKEIIEFPIDWAPEISLDGYEELRFAPNWSIANHDEYWTLVMAWHFKSKNEIPVYKIKYLLEHYFDGLMKPNHWKTVFPEPNASFSTPVIENNKLIFKGSMTFFDGFHTGEVITTNILGSMQLCENTGQWVVIFKFSPKTYDHKIWNELKKFQPNNDKCE